MIPSLPLSSLYEIPLGRDETRCCQKNWLRADLSMREASSSRLPLSMFSAIFFQDAAVLEKKLLKPRLPGT
jgi:hypothetical protein